MKALKIIVLWLLTLPIAAQLPFNVTNPGPHPFTLGNHQYSGNSITLAAPGYKISSNAKVLLTAKDEIIAQDGFEATSLSQTGEAHLKIDQSINSLNVASFHANGFTSIPQYDNFEVGLILPQNIQIQIDNFLALNNPPTSSSPPTLSPFDPDQIKITCAYTPINSNNPYWRNGFYYEDYTVQNNAWVHQNSNYKFRIRFAPPVVGDYNATIFVLINNQLLTTSSFQFNVAPSSNPGFLNMASNASLRKLQFDNGKVFFGVGQDIGFVIESPAPNCLPDVNGQLICLNPSSYDDYRGWIADLGNNGGDMLRLRLDAWDFPVQWAEHYNEFNPTNWLQKSPITGLDNFNPNQNYMWEFDRVMKLCESKNMYIMLNIMGEYSWRTKDPGGVPDDGALWGRNPYSHLPQIKQIELNTPGPQGLLDATKAFFTDPQCKSYYKKMLYYLNARWGYSTSLALWEMVNETENLDDYKTDTQFRSDVQSWICEMGAYIKSVYPSHLITNGHIADIKPLNGYLNCLDVWSENDYNASVQSYTGTVTSSGLVCSSSIGQANNGRFDIQGLNYNSQGRPFVWGEIGGDGLLDKNTDREFHNSIWSTTMMGGISCGLNWSDFEQRHGVNHRQNFNSLKTFVNRIDWSVPNVHFRATATGGNFCEVNGKRKKIHNFFSVSNSGKQAFGWAMNESSVWFSNAPNNFIDLTDWVKILTSSCPPSPNPYTIVNGSCEPEIFVTGLTPNTMFTIKIFDTYLASNQLLETQNKQSGVNGSIKFQRKMPFFGATPFYPDYAYTIEEAEGEGGFFGERPIQTGNYIDSLIEGSNISVTINGVGKEYRTSDSEIFNNSTYVYPVPAKDKIHIKSSRKDWSDSKAHLINLTGQEFEVKIDTDNSIDVSEFINGFYSLKIDDSLHSRTFKVIIQH